MIKVGTVENLFRFPVKSMEGESLERVAVARKGFHKDRTWALLENGEITGAKKIPDLLKFQAEYINEQSQDVKIICPNGEVILSKDESCSQQISQSLGREVVLSDLKPASNLKHYELSKKMDEEGLREILGLADGEPVPDFSEMPISMLLKLQRFATPPGTYFDAYPIHILSSGSLEHMRRLSGNENFTVQRFRPNIFINTEYQDDFDDFVWCHRELKIGEVVLKIDGKTPRCSMPGRAQSDIPEDKTLPRQMYEFSERNLGVYANILQAGEIKRGDKVYLLDDKDGPVKKAFKKRLRKTKKTMIDLLT